VEKERKIAYEKVVGYDFKGWKTVKKRANLGQ